MAVRLCGVLVLASLFCGTLQLVTIGELRHVLKELQEEQNDSIATHVSRAADDNTEETHGRWHLLTLPEFSDSYLENAIEDPPDSTGSKEEDPGVSSGFLYQGRTSHKDFINPNPTQIEHFYDSPNADQLPKPAFNRLSFIRLSGTTESGEFNESYSQMVSTNLNELVDFVIDVVQKEIVKKGMDQIPIADINQEFSKRIGFIKVKGKFVGTQGWFKRLSTLHRTADVIATKQGNSLVISLGMGLGTMEFGFNRYEVNFLHIRTKGKIRGKVDSNSINAQVAISLVGTQCKIILQQLKVTQFSGLSIHATGLGKLSWLLSKIFTWVTKHFQDKIIKDVEQHIAQIIATTLAKTRCDRNLMSYLGEMQKVL